MSENVKHAASTKKFAFSVIPLRVLAELSLAMLEGALKYGFFNWRTGPPIRVTDYIDALMRHITAFAEGEWLDPDSKRPHLIKAMATLVVLFDAWLFGNIVDDRCPPQADPKWIDEVNSSAADLRSRLEKK